MAEKSPPPSLFKYKTRFENHLQLLLVRQRETALQASAPASVSTLFDAIDYSTLGTGKRIRAMLVYLTAQCCNQQIDANENAACRTPELIDIAAAAVELIHCYSLIHDDLPAMDDDALRRGKPTCHIAFGEANAILAGDALQAMAFDILSTQAIGDNDKRIALIASLATAAGSNGMVGGQFYDLRSANQSISLQQLEQLHRLKTGALIESAVAMGAICAGATAPAMSALQRYAQAIGLAFQVKDDILDLEGDPEETGKTQGSDLAANKSTFPALIGLDAAKQRASVLRDDAVDALKPFNERAKPLIDLANYFVSRTK